MVKLSDADAACGPAPREDGVEAKLVGRDAPAEIVEYANVACAVENATIIGRGVLILNGWLTDPNGDVEAIYLARGELERRVEIAARSYRRDVLEYTGMISHRPGHRAGFLIIEPWPETGPEQIAVHLDLRGNDRPRMASSARELNRPLGVGWRHAFHATHNRSIRASIFRRVARTLMESWYDSGGDAPTGRVHHLSAGNADAPVVTLAIVLNRNVEMLPQTLGMFDIAAQNEAAEVLLVVTEPSLEGPVVLAARKYVHQHSLASIRVFIPDAPIPTGAAMNLALTLPTTPMVAITHDDVLPCAAGWVGRLNELLRGDNRSLAILPARTFDGRGASLSRELQLDAGEYEESHFELNKAIEATLAQFGPKLSVGAVAGRREALASATRFSDGFTVPECAFAEFVIRNAARLRVLDESQFHPFQRLHLREYAVGDPMERAWNAYALTPHLHHLSIG